MLFIVALAILLTAGIHWFAARRADYRHVRHTISELGHKGAADSKLVSWGLFFPVGVCLVAVWFIHRETAPLAATLAAVMGIGYAGAALFPCDPGSPWKGSVSQGLHNLAGGIQYVGGALVLWQLGQADGVFTALALVVAAGTLFVSLAPLGRWRGAAQRAAELALFAGLALALRP